jgi:excisionase family DNA binding protein
MSTTTTEPGITAAEAARRLDVEEFTVARWLRSGILHGRRTPGGHWRLDPEDVDALRLERSSLAGLLTSPEAADRIGVAHSTMDRYLQQGKIPAVKTPGGHWRVDPVDLDALI